MGFSKTGNFLVVLIMIATLTTIVSFVVKDMNRAPIQVASVLDNVVEIVVPQTYIPPKKLSNPPEIIKAVYVTANSAGSKSYLDYLSQLFKNTEINAVVVDIKDSTGRVSYNSGAEDVVKYSINKNTIKDIDALVNFFHDQNIYLIGRISVFEDPIYSSARPELAIYDEAKTKDLAQPVLWKDNNGLSWLDPSSIEAWDYSISLAKDALYHGFDEINFDYIRFPSDGNLKNAGFPVYDGVTPISEVINNFFRYLRASLPGEKISADLFGQTTINYNDMGIGQLIENAFENFDFISPMVYPSHYAKGFIGYANPAEYPYEVVKYSMDRAMLRKNTFLQQKIALYANGQEVGLIDASLLAKFRPWLQDFDMGADYNAEMVKSEIAATQDSLKEDFAGYMLWNPSNIYTQGAILKQQ